MTPTPRPEPVITAEEFCAGLSRLDAALVRGAMGSAPQGANARTRAEWNELVAAARQRPIKPE